MNFIKILALGIMICGLMGAGCSRHTTVPAAENKIDRNALIGPDYRKPGRVLYNRLDDKFISSTGCEVTYTGFAPRKGSTTVRVILGHGFMRSKQRMAHLAQHLASWGLAVVNVEFCNSKLWAGHHDRNGADMVAISDKLHQGKVIYVGFSAGGLAAMMAAKSDKNTLAYLGLDMVDHQGLGKKMASGLLVPFYGLVAAPSVCNANNNGLELYGLAPHSKVLSVEDASHCHFEFPMDPKCTFICGKGETQISSEEIQQTILGLSTAFLLWQTRIDTNGETWWSDGQQNFKSLKNAGYVKSLLSDPPH